MSHKVKESDEKAMMKEIYSNSKDRVAEVLKIFSHIKSDGAALMPDEAVILRVQNLLNGVVGSQKFEEDNEYKRAISVVGEWVLAALDVQYLKSQAHIFPAPLYVVKKGVEVLHLLLHRDFRRRQMSSVESQLYHEFFSLTSHFAPPTRSSPLSQDETDALLEREQVRRSS